MTSDAQRVAIAQAVGWKLKQKMSADKRVSWELSNPRGVFVCTFYGDGDGWQITALQQWLPDYLNSLDAMHEAEKVLTEEQRNDYLKILNGKGMGGAYGTGPSFYDWWRTTHATAAQRAEALLRALNLWTD